jgi:hypothetical protein
MAQAAEPVELGQATLEAFTDYIRGAEAEMERTRAEGPFLWTDTSAERAAQLREGKLAVEFWSGKRPLKVPQGLIHDWIGAVFIPGATVGQVLATIQQYDRHKDLYKPEVIDSKLLSRTGDEFEIYLRLLKKKVITVVLETDHHVRYYALDPARWCCDSATTRISEVENAGRPNETVRQPDAGYGFLWRLNTYWRFQERDGGAYVECRAISLTRDIPKALRWIIEPIVRKLPRESLCRTLDSTRRAVQAGFALSEPVREPE